MVQRFNGSTVQRFNGSRFGSGFRGSGFGTPYTFADHMVARRYQDLVCWQLANELKLRVYAIVAKAPVAKDLKYCDQIRDSARSATRNIAEGFGRYRPADFARFLLIARASLLETHDHLCDGLDLRYLSQAECKEACTLADRACGAVTKLHAYLERCARRRRKNPEP
jgi:four helix bundle protein